MAGRLVLARIRAVAWIKCLGFLLQEAPSLKPNPRLVPDRRKEISKEQSFGTLFLAG
jgi:hypothetical protein